MLHGNMFVQAAESSNLPITNNEFKDMIMGGKRPQFYSKVCVRYFIIAGVS